MQTQEKENRETWYKKWGVQMLFWNHNFFFVLDQLMHNKENINLKHVVLLSLQWTNFFQTYDFISMCTILTQGNSPMPLYKSLIFKCGKHWHLFLYSYIQCKLKMRIRNTEIGKETEQLQTGRVLRWSRVKNICHIQCRRES